MSFYDNLQTIFDSSLNTVSDSLPVAWENISFTPTQGQPWLRPTLLYSPASLLDLSGTQQNPGFYQIDLFYPTEKGPRDMLLKMGEVYEHYKNNQTISNGGVTAYIRAITRETPSGGQNGGLVISEGSWLTGSLGINFNCYTN